jgi:hypothetical protein
MNELCAGHIYFTAALNNREFLECTLAYVGAIGDFQLWGILCKDEIVPESQSRCRLKRVGDRSSGFFKRSEMRNVAYDQSSEHSVAENPVDIAGVEEFIITSERVRRRASQAFLVQSVKTLFLLI